MLSLDRPRPLEAALAGLRRAIVTAHSNCHPKAGCDELGMRGRTVSRSSPEGLVGRVRWGFDAVMHGMYCMYEMTKTSAMPLLEPMAVWRLSATSFSLKYEIPV